MLRRHPTNRETMLYLALCTHHAGALSLSLPYLFFIRIFHCRKEEKNKMLKFILQVADGDQWRWRAGAQPAPFDFTPNFCFQDRPQNVLRLKFLRSSRTLQVASTSRQVVAAAATSHKYCPNGLLCYCFLVLFLRPPPVFGFHLFLR